MDSLCLALIALATALPYVGKLGFYSDDWYILASFHADTLRHEFGIHSILRDFAARPVQGFYLALLYRLFGFHPFGYHLVNTAVIAAAIPLFYWLLVRLKVDRASAFAAAVIFIVLPQLSTIRVWYAAFQIPLSMLAAWVSMHCQLSVARSGKLGWAAGAALAALFSIGAYEIFAPLIAGFAVALLALQWRSPVRGPGRRTIALAVVVMLIAVSVLAKFALSDRPPAPEIARYTKGLIQLVRPDYDWRTDYALNIFAAANVHFWWPVLGWARAAEALFRGQLDWSAPAAAIFAAFVAFWRVRGDARSRAASVGDGQLLLVGLTAFVLGHAVFVIVPAMFFSPAGMANRALVAGAVGVALIVVAILQYVSGRIAENRRQLAYSSAVAALVMLGTLRIEQIAAYWTAAPAIQQSVVAAARADLKGLPSQSFVMLDNVCPYHGPALIFEAPWDVSGALSLAVGKTIHGDAVSPRMSLRNDGLATSIYGEQAFYPYAAALYVYDPARHLLARLGDLGAARRYFRQASKSRTPCPRGYVGHGVLI
ncbi:MAG: hypothetical protein ABI770_04910 [Sphingomicrobium sp.]